MVQCECSSYYTYHAFFVMGVAMKAQEQFRTDTAAFGYEPSIGELLAEPMVRQLMARDGVKVACMQTQLERLSRSVIAANMAVAGA